MNMLLNLTLFRHAPTVYNNDGVYMGILDIPCDFEELNKIQGKYDYMAHSIFRIYSSPLSRAYETAKYLFKNNTIYTDNRLIEKNLGSWAGQRKKYLNKIYPQAFLTSGYLDPTFIPEGGESHDAIVSRCKSFLIDIINSEYNNKDKNRLVIVTHNGVLRVMRYLIEGYPINNIYKYSEPFLSPIEFNFDILKWKSLIK